LNFPCSGDEFFDRPALGRAVFGAGIQTENRSAKFLPGRIFSGCRFISSGVTSRKLRRQRLGIRAKRGG
jgi:hypothetical protein